MNKWIITLLVLFSLVDNFAQENVFERQANKTKEKVKQRAENKLENKIDQTLDKTEEEIEQGVSKKKNKSSDSDNDQRIDERSESHQSDSKKTFHVSSKFDFVPGKKVVLFEDFSTTVLGDFPLCLNTNAGGEVVRIEEENCNYFKFAKQGIVSFNTLKSLPDNFTLEFDLFVSENFSEMQDGLKVFFVKKQEQTLMFDPFFNVDPQVGFNIHPTFDLTLNSTWVFNNNEQKIIENQTQLKEVKTGKIHVAIWRQNNRVRLYLDEHKVWDLPMGFLPKMEYELIFATYTWDGDLALSNVRLAEGDLDTRAIFNSGKFVTSGILFTTGSDQVKPESYGLLKEIASTLKLNPEKQVKIIGYTDSDGDATDNLELSLKRAQAVKSILINEFGIPMNQLSVEGKGETNPIDTNNTAAGKANNRRVEFIQM